MDEDESLELIELPMINIGYWLGHHRFAIRRSKFVPAIGDEVRFKRVIYKITGRIWIYDEPIIRVELEMKKAKS